jgi:hypothetical protein
MHNKTTLEGPFIKFSEDTTCQPHCFKAYRYNRGHGKCWQAIVEGCLESWRIQAEGFFENVSATGFKKVGLGKILNLHGENKLPPTPPEDNNITKNPAITDMTEILALQMLQWNRSDLVLPYPRVLHKELHKLQHHGIDAIGYTKDADEYTLYVIEVMATVDVKHPPKTVKDHLKQILPDTLNAPSFNRLLNDLRTIHDESKDDKDRNVLNGFIISTLNGSLSQNQALIASPLLIRRFNEFNENDWKPFIESKSEFDQAIIPSTVLFIAVECHATFSGLLDLIKQTASGAGASIPVSEGSEE